MATATRTQRRYDHRLRNLVRSTQDIHCAIQRGVPRSTARSWLTDSDVPVVALEALNLDATQVQQEVLRLRRRVQKLTALLRVLLVVYKISGYSLSQTRLPDGGHKRSLLRDRAIANGAAATIRAARRPLVVVALSCLEPPRPMCFQ